MNDRELREQARSERVDSRNAEVARLTAERDALRVKLDVSEMALAQERTLTQKLGVRCEQLLREGHKACLFWESAKNYSLHDIRLGMRAFRKVLNQPTPPPAEPVAPCTGDADVLRLADEWLDSWEDAAARPDARDLPHEARLYDAVFKRRGVRIDAELARRAKGGAR